MQLQVVAEADGAKFRAHGQSTVSRELDLCCEDMKHLIHTRACQRPCMPPEVFTVEHSMPPGTVLQGKQTLTAGECFT